MKKDNSLSVSVGGELSDMTKLVIQNLDVEKEKATSTQMDVTMADTATAKDVTTDEPQDALSPKLEAIDYEPPTNEQTQSQRSVEIIIVDDTSDEEDEPDVADTDASMNVLVEGTRNDEIVKDGVQEQATMKEQIDDSLDAMNVHASKDEDTIMEKNTDDDNIMKTLEEKVIEEKKDDSGEKATEETKEDSEAEDKWWAKVFRKNPLMGDIENGGKVVLLLQILAHADMIGEYDVFQNLYISSRLTFLYLIKYFSLIIYNTTLQAKRWWYFLNLYLPSTLSSLQFSPQTGVVRFLVSPL